MTTLTGAERGRMGKSEGCNQGNTARQGENEHLSWSLGNWLQEDRSWAFPGASVIRTPRFHCRGHGFNP